MDCRTRIAAVKEQLPIFAQKLPIACVFLHHIPNERYICKTRPRLGSQKLHGWWTGSRYKMHWYRRSWSWRLSTKIRPKNDLRATAQPLYRSLCISAPVRSRFRTNCRLFDLFYRSLRLIGSAARQSHATLFCPRLYPWCVVSTTDSASLRSYDPPRFTLWRRTQRVVSGAVQAPLFFRATRSAGLNYLIYPVRKVAEVMRILQGWRRSLAHKSWRYCSGSSLRTPCLSSRQVAQYNTRSHCHFIRT